MGLFNGQLAARGNLDSIKRLESFLFECKLLDFYNTLKKECVLFEMLKVAFLILVEVDNVLLASFWIWSVGFYGISTFVGYIIQIHFYVNN